MADPHRARLPLVEPKLPVDLGSRVDHLARETPQPGVVFRKEAIGQTQMLPGLHPDRRRARTSERVHPVQEPGGAQLQAVPVAAMTEARDLDAGHWTSRFPVREPSIQDLGLLGDEVGVAIEEARQAAMWHVVMRGIGPETPTAFFKETFDLLTQVTLRTGVKDQLCHDADLARQVSAQPGITDWMAATTQRCKGILMIDDTHPPRLLRGRQGAASVPDALLATRVQPARRAARADRPEALAP